MTIKAKIYLLVFCSLPFILRAQNSSEYEEIISKGEQLISKKEYDSAFFHFSKALADSPPLWKGKLFFKAGLALSKSENYLESISYFDSSLVWGRRQKEKLLISQSLINIGASNIELDRIAEGLHYSKLALESIDPIGNELLLAATNFNIAYTYKNQGLNHESIPYLFSAAEGFESIGNLAYLGKTQQTLGNVYRGLGKDSLSIAYHKMALATRKKHGGAKGVSSSLNDLANTYKKMGDFQKSIELYNRSLLEGDSILKMTTLGNLGEVYLKLGNYGKSEALLKKALSLSVQEKDSKSICYIKNNLGQLYLELNQLPTALDHLISAQSLAKKKGFLDILMENSTFQKQIHELQGNFDEALLRANEELKIMKQIFNLEEQQNASKYTIKFEVNELTKQNKVLAKESLYQKLLVKEEKTNNQILSLLLLVSALFIIFLIYAFVQKRRLANFQRAQKIEVQHRTKNFLQTLINIFEYQKIQSQDLGMNSLIEENETRVDAMLMVHRSLSQNMDTINFSAYCQDLVQQISKSYEHDRLKVIVELDLDPNIILESNQATLLALIVNELVSNSFKHGLITVSKPKLSVQLKDFEKELFLLIADNGERKNEIPIQKDPKKGLGLIEIFVQQLNGVLTTNYHSGTKTSITIKKRASN